MADVNTQLQSLLLRRAVDRTRYENGCLRAILRAWRQVQAAILETVRTAGLFDARPVGASPFGPRADRLRQLGPLLDQLAAQLGLGVQRAAECVAGDLPALAELEFLELPRAVQRILDWGLTRPLGEQEGDPPAAPFDVRNLTFTQVPTQQLAQLAASPLGGARYAASFADLGASTLASVRGVLTTGLLQGLGVPRVSRQLQGILGGARWKAERIVRSEFVRVGNQAALATFEQNRALLKAVRWLSTLDARTCLQCAVLDGKQWADPSRARLPVTSTHPNCRCTIVPVVKGFDALGLPPSTRASFSGQVPSTLTYVQWFTAQSPVFQRGVLGPTRFKLWQRGELKLTDFATAHGTKSVRDALAKQQASPGGRIRMPATGAGGKIVSVSGDKYQKDLKVGDQVLGQLTLGITRGSKYFFRVNPDVAQALGLALKGRTFDSVQSAIQYVEKRLGRLPSPPAVAGLPSTFPATALGQGRGLPEIEEAPGAFLVRNQLTDAKLPATHYDGLAKITFHDGQWIKAGVVDAAGTYAPWSRTIQLAVNAPQGGNIRVFGGGTVLHEVGHHVHLAKLTDAAATEWAAYSRNGQAARISAYARTNRGEHFAEAYRAYTKGGTQRALLKNVEPEAYRFMQAVVRPGSPRVLPAGEFAPRDWERRYAD